MLKKQEILDKTDNGLQVFKHYLNIDFKIGTNFKNPLYDDHNASCNIYFDKGKQIYRMKDFGNDDYSGDCFFFVGKLLNLNCQNATDFVQILKIINRDLHLGLDNQSPKIQKVNHSVKSQDIQQTQTAKPYEYIPQTLTETELNYWQSQGIDRNTLNRYSVVSLALYKSENKENKPFSIQSSKQEPMFACVAVVEELYRLAGIYNTCIVTVLHFIPNRLKLRGHLGSELQRKSATILSIEKEENSEISVVKALKVRDGSPLDVPLMQFKWDKELKMHTYIGEKSKKEKDKRKTKDLETVAKEIFEKKSSWNYGDLCTELQSFMEVKERTAKNYIKYMREKEIIIKDNHNDQNFVLALL
ncbi:MAG: hypothetical protein KGV44_06045 [Flavobacteriaceae bacterium]|nr:hypothetical protein [Flavobacteriaceae bacterium]